MSLCSHALVKVVEKTKKQNKTKKKKKHLNTSSQYLRHESCFVYFDLFQRLLIFPVPSVTISQILIAIVLLFKISPLKHVYIKQIVLTINLVKSVIYLKNINHDLQSYKTAYLICKQALKTDLKKKQL